MGRVSVVLSVLFMSSQVLAQSVTTSEGGTAVASETPAPVPAATPEERSLKFRGFLSSAIGTNFTYPGLRTDISGLRSFDHNYGTFSVDSAQLSMQYAPGSPGDAGFRVDLNAGYSIPRRSGSAGSLASLGISDFDLLQAYASYIFPIGRGLRLDAGKFTTHMGAEVIEGPDGFNFNYSRSILFFNTIPFAHTGVRLSTSINDVLSVMLLGVNGADNVLDNNGSKGLGMQVTIAPSPMATFYVNWLMSANQQRDNHDRRQYVDLVANVKATDALTLNVNIDYTTESDTDAQTLDPTLTSPTAERSQFGVAAIVNYAINDWVSAAVRAEYWSSGQDLYGTGDVADGQADSLGLGDGVGDGNNENYYELTLTPTFTLGGNFALRPEIRVDSVLGSEKLVWVQDGNPTPLLGTPPGMVTDEKSMQVTGAINFVAWY